jgi:hypothetical protein
MNFLIIQENGRHKNNRNFRECFCLKRSLLKLGHECTVWGLGHDNFKDIDLNSYEVVIDLENYDSGWVPNLSSVKSYKIIWSIDSHCRGNDYYINRYKNNKCQLILQATKEFIRNDYEIWFPNCFDNTLIKPMDVLKRCDVGFCGNVVNRKNYLDFLKCNFNFIADIFVIGEDMVKAINSYKIHFNKNMANDVNYRNFETIGCKIPLITNYNSAYNDLGFKDGENCMIYNNYNELIDKINILLKNEDILKSVSEKGYELSIKHTYDERAKLLIDFLYNKI